LKKEIDEKLDEAERLLKEMETELRLCRRILNGQNTMLKRIKRIYRQYELFPEKKDNPRTVRRIIEKCLRHLVETI